MEKEVAIIVCNYNKKEYVLPCIQSLLESSFQDFTIYVVDNASQDGSAAAIRESFGDKVILLENKENLGGSGGFNTGLRKALEKDYKYLVCADNDVRFDKYAIEELKKFLEQHPETGMVGSRVYFMDEPEKIWGFGGTIDYERYVHVDHYRNQRDSEEIPPFYYCDYVPACSLMVRTKAVREVGIMPEENFIYWDDMEWGYRFNQAGYRVAVWEKSKAWHKGGGRNAANTFIHYYMWRNRIRFFMKTLPPERKEAFAEGVLSEMFRMIYSVNLKGETNIVKTLMYAFDDAVHGITGKAGDYKILQRPEVNDRLEAALKGAETLLIRFNGSYEGLGNIVRNIRKKLPELKIAVSIKDRPEPEEELRRHVSECSITKEYFPEQYDRHLVMCEHIFKLPPGAPEDHYIDAWCNIIYSEDDFIYASSFEQTRRLFVLCKKELLLQGNIDYN